MSLKKPSFTARLSRYDRTRPTIDLISGSGTSVELNHYVRERLERFFVGLPCNSETMSALQPFLENLLTELVCNGMLKEVDTYEGTRWIFKEKDE